MKGGFDLYGNYYPNAQDAWNAETSQMNEIDNRNNRKEILKLENIEHQRHYEIANLENRIKELEDLLSKKKWYQFWK